MAWPCRPLEDLSFFRSPDNTILPPFFEHFSQISATF
uniref:Uncharacterized protein n=1 Tax=Jarrellvirus sp. TaxID=2960496 RepID=A0AAU8HXV7_9CAUD